MRHSTLSSLVLSERLTAAYVLFLDATNRLNEHLTTPEPPGGEVFDRLGWVRSIHAPRHHSGCLGAHANRVAE